MEIRLLGIIGSPRHGNTEFLAKEALSSAENMGNVETTLVHLGEMDIRPCKADYRCITHREGDPHCPTWSDDMETIYPKIRAADAIILASPVYYANVTGQMKIMMDRMQPFKSRGVDWKNQKHSDLHGVLRNKIGAGLVVARLRNGGQESAIYAIHNFLHMLDMIPVGSGEVVSCGFGGAASLWTDPENPTRGVVLDGVKSDKLGLQTARALGRRVVEVARLMKAGKQVLKGSIDNGGANLGKR